MRILLFLFLFGLVPLILAVVINLPLVLERIDLFYRHAFLQNLRADFSDLDQHLASRDASVRLLARLPEPGALVRSEDEAEIDLARARYTQWINRILGEERDITEILFLDESGVERFWLERDGENGDWTPTTQRLRGVSPDQIALLLSGRVNNVALSPLRIDLEADDPARVFTMQLLAPIVSLLPGDPPIGFVAITLDVGGLVRRDDKTLWVHEDGRYLHLPGQPPRTSDAFADFPGLVVDFRAGRIALWEAGARRAIWVPMFRTDDGGTLWVGRPVDVQPLQDFRTEIAIRVLAIVLGLLILQFIVARWITRRAERISRRLTEGVKQTLALDEPVTFDWSGSSELRQLASDLTELSRTHARQARNLRAHTRELEATNRYKSEFLANVSHELRTPLNSILLLSKLLAESGDESGPVSRERADVIHKAGRDLKGLIDNILDLSRIEAGRLELHVENVAIDRLLEDLRQLLAPQFDDKGLTLNIVIGPDAPGDIETDSDKVRQILKNFLANAVKFTEHGGARLVAARASAPYTISLSVVDTGVGISPGKQDAIFEAFQQADGSTSRRYGGTGLGLTISRQLAELLGGEIVLESEPGKGATFALLLPATGGGGDTLPAERMQLLESSVAEASPEPVPDRLAGLEVLLMEPNVRRQLQISNILCDWGMSLHLADDVDEAIETVAELDRVDFLMIDALMPAGGACATIEKMREHLDEDTVVIAMIAADTGKAVRDDCSATGADDSIELPVDARVLSELLISHLPSGAAK